MNTKIVMIGSAILMGAIGVLLSFLPAEVMEYLGLGFTELMQLILQLAGALYMAFAIFNWMARANVMGGIYNRPMVLANFTHFLMGALALIKAVRRDDSLPDSIWALAGLYAALAVLFGIIFFKSPKNMIKAVPV